MTKIIAVTACPSGVAHTYMAAEALESAAKAKGWEVKVETQGSIGLENELTAEDVASADMVILTKDIGIKNFSPSYRALDGYDVEKLYVDKQSLEQRGLTESDLLVPVEVLDAKAMGELMAEQDVILSF